MAKECDLIDPGLKGDPAGGGTTVSCLGVEACCGIEELLSDAHGPSILRECPVSKWLLATPLALRCTC
jgi:hypothetical protein